MKYIARPLLNFFTGHMTLNAKDKEFLENKWLVKNVQFIPSGIRVERFLKLGRNIHQNLNFITVGIYRSQKGIDLSLSAISKFNDRYPGNKAIFRFVGGGELKPLIEKYKKSHKNVIDLGYLKYEDIPKAYAQSDLYLLSSREEPFGLVLIEAWSSGIPVISTKTEGPLDMVKPNINGWFIKNISPDSIYDSISSLYHKWLKKPDMFLQMADECRQTGKKYSIDRTAKSMNKYFFQQI